MIDVAIQNLRPNSKWIVGTTYESLEWLDEEQSKPTKEEIEAEITRLEEEYKSKEYARLREAEYPPITDYIDGVVKGDQNQINAYISACQAVKNKYPKPD